LAGNGEGLAVGSEADVSEPMLGIASFVHHLCICKVVE